MRRVGLGPVLAAAVLLSGCSQVVPGAATAAPPAVPAAPDPATPGPGAPAPRSGLTADVVADECLLNAAEFGALLGEAVRPPAQGAVTRDDGSSSSSCVATAGTEPLALINVYAVKAGTPAEYVLAGAPGGRRELSGVGEAAAVVQTRTGPTLQLASPGFLVTILVAGRSPDDDAWRTAATAALSRLPG